MRKTRIIKKQKTREKSCVEIKGRRFFLFITSLFLVILITSVVYKMSRQTKRQSGINEEISKLQGQINKLEGENQDLDELIDYLKTDNFKEREAKDKLNLIKEGEQMVLVREDGLVERIPVKGIKKETQLIVHRESYYYWWHYFFNIKKG